MESINNSGEGMVDGLKWGEMFTKLILPNQSPEIVFLACSSPLLSKYISDSDFIYDTETEELSFTSSEQFLAYTCFLRREYKEEYDKIVGKPISIVYGKEEQVRSTIPFIYSEEWGKNPKVQIGNSDEHIYVVSMRGRDVNRKKLIDTCIFKNNLSDPLEMDDLVNNVYRSSKRLLYSEYYRAFHIVYHLGLTKGITPDVVCISDMEEQRVKYKLDNYSDYINFGVERYEYRDKDEICPSLPLRAIQWKDSEDEFGIWIKPTNLFKYTELPAGKPILINSSFADISDVRSYNFNNNWYCLVLSSDPRYLLLRLTGNYSSKVLLESIYGVKNGYLDMILFNENGWNYPRQSIGGSRNVPIYDFDSFVTETMGPSIHNEVLVRNTNLMERILSKHWYGLFEIDNRGKRTIAKLKDLASRLIRQDG